MANYNFVIDSHFKPFSFQELVAPFMIYKDAYDKAEERYYQMADRSNKFKYLSEILPANSRARRIYEGFANDLKSKTADFLANGLTMGTRGALTDLRGRIQGEIGMLEDAKTALEEVRRVRDAKLAQDPSTKFAVKDLNIDQFLFDQRPNLYSVSTDDLYKRGAAAGLAASQRVYSYDGSRKTMGDYYFDFMEEHGWAPEADRAFRDQMKDNEDFKKAMQATLTEKQVYKNITDPDDLEATMDAFLNGWCDGAIHKVTHNLQRNPGKPSWAEEQQAAYQSRMASVSERRQSLDERQYQDAKRRSDDIDKLYFNFDESGKHIIGVKEPKDNPGYASGYYPKEDGGIGILKEGQVYDPVARKVIDTRTKEEKEQAKADEKEIKDVDKGLLSLRGSYNSAKKEFVNPNTYGRQFQLHLTKDAPTGGVEPVDKTYSLIGGVDRHHKFAWTDGKWFRLNVEFDNEGPKYPDYPNRLYDWNTKSNLVAEDGNLGISSKDNGFGENFYPKVLAAGDREAAFNADAELKTQIDNVIKDFRANVQQGYGATIPKDLDIPYEVVEVPNEDHSRPGYLVYVDLDSLGDKIEQYNNKKSK